MTHKAVCPLCGKEFDAYGRQKYCKGPHYRTCIECGKQFEVTPKHLSQEFCSKKCRGMHDKRTGKSKQNSEKAKETWKEKYGVENVAQLDSVKEKKKQTSLKHYGVEHPWLDEEVQRKRQETIKRNHGSIYATQDPKVMKKIEKTNLERYGTKAPAQSDEVKRKINNHFNDAYGVNSAMQVPEFKKRYIDESMRKYGVKYAFLSDEAKEKARKTNEKKYGSKYFVGTSQHARKTTETVMKRYGVEFTGQLKSLHEKAEKTMMERYGTRYACLVNPGNQTKVSSVNRAFSQFLTENGVENELEFALPEKSYDVRVGNVLVEINPTYTHNSMYSHFNPEGLPKDYHVKRTKYANEHGYQCVHVWDWDDWNKVLNLLTPKETLYARSCDAVEVDVETASKFLNEYHLQGSCRGQIFCTGLTYNGNLIAVMSFGNPRYNKNYEWELLRLCFDSKYKVIGGSEKMFSYFVQTNNPRSIISYCDASKFSGDVYIRLGMSLKSTSSPRKHWYSLDDKNKPKHITDNFLRQRGYDQIFNEQNGKGTNNELLVAKRGYLPVYDCGQMTFEWSKKVCARDY